MVRIANKNPPVNGHDNDTCATNKNYQSIWNIHDQFCTRSASFKSYLFNGQFVII